MSKENSKPVATAWQLDAHGHAKRFIETTEDQKWWGADAYADGTWTVWQDVEEEAQSGRANDCASAREAADEWARENAHILTWRLPPPLDILAISPARVIADDDLSYPAFVLFHDEETGERADIELPRERVSPGEDVAIAVVRGEIASALHLLAYVRHCGERDEADHPRCGCTWASAAMGPWPSLACPTGKMLAARVRACLVIS